MNTLTEPYSLGIYEWPDVSRYEYLSEHSEFNSLTEDQKQLGANLLSHFFVGVNVAYFRYGNKYADEDLLFATNAGDTTIAYAVDMKTFAVNLSWFLRVVKDPDRYIGTETSVGGIENIQSLEDFFEIAGVEEAAHRIYFKEEKKRSIPLTRIGKKYDYYLDDPENRALLWKAGFIKRYFPQYYPSIRKTIDGARELRTRLSEGLDVSDLPNDSSKYSWVSNKEYNYFKADLYNNNYQQVINLFNSNKEFKSLDDASKEIGVTLYANFLTGIRVITRRLGEASDVIPITFDNNQVADYGTFGVNEGGEYIIHIESFLELIHMVREDNDSIKALGVMKEISVSDLVEIAGVELGSIMMFMKSKENKYSDGDLQMRSMVCKKAYAKKYMSRLGQLFSEAKVEDFEK